MKNTADDQSMEQIHREEQRVCPDCAYAILNPLTDRCPRCFALVPRVEINCGSCTHQGNCDFVHLTEFQKEKKQ